MQNGPDDFSKDQAAKINEDLFASESGSQRDAIYKRNKTSKQMWIQVAKHYNLKELPKVKSSKKATPRAVQKKSSLKTERPQKTTPTVRSKPAPAQTKPRASAQSKKTSLSVESKELLIKMMAKLLED